MSPILKIEDVSKTYEGGFQALKSVSLEIEKGEILALLGPNGAGKTTLISCVCGISRVSSGKITAGGYDIDKQPHQARKLIGLVPQEIPLEPFERPINTLRLSQGLFGQKRDDAHIEKVLRQLSLWDKRNAKHMELSGGMRRRVLIAKALSHKPDILFLDEPTAGVDVELRKDMWEVVRELRESGVTIILTTHYIEEAEEMADRIAVINKGEILLVEEKDQLMKKLGRKTLTIDLQDVVQQIPESLKQHELEIANDGQSLIYQYDTNAERTGITHLLNDINAAGLVLSDIHTKQSSLEEIFINLVREDA